ncbi:MAG: polyprenyl synthetase family protein [Acidobacteriota bacterium]|nr:polyprenyl synthetase family protein [Acidobacteriota bacterium]
MNNSADLWRYVERVKPEIEKSLNENLPLAPAALGTDFNEALAYALFPGGKRLRPVLTLLSAELIGGAREKVLPAAAAVEFVHTSSLIFDDLPCMDNAPERRGKSSLHQKFGEGNAVLVALALLNASYHLVFASVKNDCPMCASAAIKAHRELTDCIGAAGMVGGQSIDLAIAKSGSFDADGIESLRNLKTSALMRMALRLGAILSGANENQLNALSCFAALLGEAYQTSDDLLDLQEDLHISQTTERRETFALALGASKAQIKVDNLISNAKDTLLTEFGERKTANLLCAMADYVAERRI